MKIQNFKEKIKVVKARFNHSKRMSYETLKFNCLEEYVKKVKVKISFEDKNIDSKISMITFNNPISNIGYHFYTTPKEFYIDKRNFYIRSLQTYPLFINFMKSYPKLQGNVMINWSDQGRLNQELFNGKFISFCCLKTDPFAFLIPDHIFIESQSYKPFRQKVEQKWIQWNERKSTAFWRGALTGQYFNNSNWESNLRIRLCEIAKKYHDGIINAKITKIPQFLNFEIKEHLENSNLMSSYVPCIEFLKYKYVIDIDGHSNSWPGLFTKLITGSCVLKVESQWKQWYYNDLKPWINYIPIKSDMSDLIEKINWCINNDDQACLIGENGRKLALSMTVKGELKKANEVILEALV